MRTGFTALGLALAGFIVPFMFAYNQALLFQAELWRVALATTTAILGVIALAACVQNYYISKLNVIERVLFGITAFALIKPGLVTDIFGIAVLGGVLYLQRRKAKYDKVKMEASMTEQKTDSQKEGS
jgi:TRAP-type uncharacterized transport system fused permease subunit